MGGDHRAARAYDWEPTTYMKGVREDQILGVEGALWSETVHNIGSALYMTLPRLPALAEVGWTSAGEQELGGFRERIAGARGAVAAARDELLSVAAGGLGRA